MSTKRNDQPKRYTTNSVRRKLMSGAGRVGRRGQTTYFDQRGSHPTDFRFDRCVFFPAACWTRSGVENTRIGQNGPIYPEFCLI